MRAKLFTHTFLVVLCVSGHAHGAKGLLAELEQHCPRPKVGLYEGACEARSPTLRSQSAYSLHKWITCMLGTVGMGNGGSQDASFYQELVPEWEKEIDVNLQYLDKLLSEKDKARLRKEQENWKIARTRAIERKLGQPTREGSMYGVFYERSVMELSEHRALELGCRIQKLTTIKWPLMRQNAQPIVPGDAAR